MNHPAGNASSVAALLTAAVVRSKRAAISLRPSLSQMLEAVISVVGFCSMPHTIVQQICTGKGKMFCRTTFLYAGYSPGMDIEQKERLARRGDMGREAMSFRLRAARNSTGMNQQQLARDMGEGMTKQKLYNAEVGQNDPPKALMRYFYRAHRIDFNFLIHGDFAQLPSDVQSRLFGALEALANEPGQAAGSDQHQDEQQNEQVEDKQQVP